MSLGKPHLVGKDRTPKFLDKLNDCLRIPRLVKDPVHVSFLQQSISRVLYTV